MRAITKRSVITLLAVAPEHPLLLLELHLHGAELGLPGEEMRLVTTLQAVRPVAEGLFGASTAGAPPVDLSRLHSHGMGPLAVDVALRILAHLELICIVAKVKFKICAFILRKLRSSLLCRGVSGCGGGLGSQLSSKRSCRGSHREPGAR